MFDFEDNKELVVCSKPPVNGNICDKFIAIDKNLSHITPIWNDDLNGFIIQGTSVVLRYGFLESGYDKFIWVKHGK